MCEHCGNTHPEFDDIKADLLYLDRIYDKVKERAQAREEDQDKNGPGPDNYGFSVNDFPVDQFVHAVVQDITDDFMQVALAAGHDMRTVVHDYGQEMMLYGFAIGQVAKRLSYGRFETKWLAGIDVSYPTEEEVQEWEEEQRRRLKERNQAARAVVAPVVTGLLDHLRKQGVEISEEEENEAIKSVADSLPRKETQTGDDGLKGLYL